MKEVKIIDCECDGFICCGGRGIAVFQVKRDGKKMNLCTRCDLYSDKDKKILKYCLKIPAEKLTNFDSLGAICLAYSIKESEFPLV